MKSFKAFLVGVVISLMSISQAQACIADFLAKVDFHPKDGSDLVIHIEEGISGTKKAIYRYKADFDGSLKLTAIALAGKNLEESQLQALKLELRDGLIKFINYWDDPKRSKKTSKAVKQAVFEARKMLASLKENKLSEDDLERLTANVISKVNEEKSDSLRTNSFLVYNEHGKIEKEGEMTGISKSLEAQLPKGFYHSAMDRTINRSLGEDTASCGGKSYAAEVLSKPRDRKDGFLQQVQAPPAARQSDTQLGSVSATATE